MTYLDRYRGMSDAELADWAQVLFDKVADTPQGTSGLIELRNICPFLIQRLRDRIAAAGDYIEIPRLDRP